jgi:hypothetical protein
MPLVDVISIFFIALLLHPILSQPPGMGGGAGGPPGIGGEDQPNGGQSNSAGKGGATMMGPFGGRGEFGVIQTVGPEMEMGYEEEAPPEPHPEQKILTIDGTIQTIDEGINIVKKRGGNAILNLGEGDHTIHSTLKVGKAEDTWKGIVINFHHVSLIGSGIKKTKLIGGIKSFQAKHILITDLTITAPVNGSALWIEGEDVRVERASIEGSMMDGVTVQEGTITMIDVEIHNNQRRGLFVCGYETTLIGKNLNVHHNLFHGLDVVSGAIVDLYGKKSSFHHNGVNGIIIEFMSDVTIYLDSNHETFSNNNGNETIVEEGSTLEWVGHREL